MNKTVIILLTVGIVGTIIWQTNSQDPEPVVMMPDVEEMAQPVVPALQEENISISEQPEATVEISQPAVEEQSIPEVAQELNVPDQSPASPLTEEEKVFYTKKRDEAEKEIKQSLSVYMDVLKDPVKRAELEESVRAKHLEYSDAVSKLGGQQ